MNPAVTATQISHCVYFVSVAERLINNRTGFLTGLKSCFVIDSKMFIKLVSPPQQQGNFPHSVTQRANATRAQASTPA
ncbi:hypothetical protein K239x_33710 [Planctomycetes bacterium K23_9]|uniref:Uncharacterized protein n=1 Tax=Stieleria marina TaxID=1930275 RepID=A0A517NWA1_9BACT|nr:hypothetical protein K239x_33710 [Planctomycetes bacterium K23_9]